MLLILSPIVSSGGLICVRNAQPRINAIHRFGLALTPVGIYSNRLLSICQEILNIVFKTVREGVEPSSPARNSS